MNQAAWQEFTDYGLQNEIRELWRSGAKGTMQANFGGRQRTLYFEDGVVQFGHSDAPSEKLHQVLISQGVITEEQFEAVRANFNTGQSIGRNLLEMGLINRSEFIKGIRGTVFSVFTACLNAPSGSFQYESGPLAEKTPKCPLLYPDDIVRAILMMKDKAWVSAQFGGDLDFAVRFNPENPLTIDAENIAQFVPDLLKSIEGTSNFRRLAFDADVDDFVLLKFIYALKLMKFVIITEEDENQEEVTKPDLGDVWNKLRHIVAESEQPKGDSSQDLDSGAIATERINDLIAEGANSDMTDMEAEANRTTDLLSHLVNDPRVKGDGPSFKVRSLNASRHEIKTDNKDVELDVGNEAWDNSEVANMEDVTYTGLDDVEPPSDAADLEEHESIKPDFDAADNPPTEPVTAPVDEESDAGEAGVEQSGGFGKAALGAAAVGVAAVGAAAVFAGDSDQGNASVENEDRDSLSESSMPDVATAPIPIVGDSQLDASEEDDSLSGLSLDGDDSVAESVEEVVFDDEDPGGLAIDDSFAEQSFDDEDLAAAAVAADDESIQMPDGYAVDQSDFEADQQSFPTKPPALAEDVKGLDEPTAPVNVAMIAEEANEQDVSFEESFVDESGAEEIVEDVASDLSSPVEEGEPVDVSAAFSQALDEANEVGMGDLGSDGLDDNDVLPDLENLDDEDELDAFPDDSSGDPEDLGSLDMDQSLAGIESSLPNLDLELDEQAVVDDGNQPEAAMDIESSLPSAFEDDNPIFEDAGASGESSFDLEAEIAAAQDSDSYEAFTGFDDLDKTVAAPKAELSNSWEPATDPFAMDSGKVADREQPEDVENNDVDPSFDLDHADDMEPEALSEEAESWQGADTTPATTWPEGMDTSPQPDPRRKIPRWLGFVALLVSLAALAFAGWRYDLLPFFGDSDASTPLADSSGPVTTPDSNRVDSVDTVSSSQQDQESDAVISNADEVNPAPANGGSATQSEALDSDLAEPGGELVANAGESVIESTRTVSDETVTAPSQPVAAQERSDQASEGRNVRDNTTTEQPSGAVDREALNTLRDGDFGTAAGMWRERMSAKKQRFTLGLFMVCDTENVESARQLAGGDARFFVLPKQYAGKACYWVCWGDYPSKRAALNARSEMPPALLSKAPGINAYRLSVLIP